MGLRYPKAKLIDDILSVIIKTSCFSLMEIGDCFKRLDRSFDKLLKAIDMAKTEGLSLSLTIDLMELGEG